MAFRITTALTICFFLLLVSCSSSIVSANHPVFETEPNNNYNQANGPIVPGLVYTGTIAKNREVDGDYFYINAEAGETYSFRFETRENSPMSPQIVISSAYVTYLWVLSGRKGEFTVPVIEDGPLFFRVSEEKNDSADKGQFVGGSDYSYWFTVSRGTFCHTHKQAIGAEDEFSFSLNPGEMGYFDVTPRKGWGGLESWCGDKESSDTWLLLFNCSSKLVVAGNDDRDVNGTLLNPWIYRQFHNEDDIVLITSPIKLNVKKGEREQCVVKSSMQKDGKELEPNDSFQFANYLINDAISGYLDDSLHTVAGDKTPDPDYFKTDTQKQHVLTVDITAEEDKKFSSEIWQFSYNYTGGYYIPLKFNRLFGESPPRYRIKAFTPFPRATTFVKLSGVDVSYRMETKQEPVSIERTGDFSESFDSDECSGIVMKWIAPDEPYIATVSVTESDHRPPGLYLFSEDGAPYLNVEDGLFDPTVSLVPSPGKKDWYIMVFPLDCSVDDNLQLRLSVSVDKPIVLPTDFSEDNPDMKAEVNKRYRGFIDTDNNLIENRYTVSVPNDGILVVQTAPDQDSTDPGLNTVVRLYNDYGDVVISNDDAIEHLWFNQWSFLSWRVKKGERYHISVKPFMDDSSDIPSLNIRSHYILDMHLY